MSKNANWVATTATVESRDWEGNPIQLDGVPAETDPATGKVRVDIDDVIKAKHQLLAENLDFDNPRQVQNLMLIFAKIPYFKSQYIGNKYKFNKMLFFLKRALEKENLGESFVLDEIASGRSGPIPIHLKDDLKALQEKRLVDIEWSKTPGKSTVVTLTAEGERVGKLLWDKSPEQLRSAVQAMKEQFFPMGPESIKKKVIAECPEYHRTYTDLDME